MLKLVVNNNKLLLIKGGITYCAPFCFFVSGALESEVFNFRSIDSEIFYFSVNFNDIFDETDSNFADVETLTTFLIGYVGFKTATGGSVANIDSAKLLKSGQITSYATGDDGDVQNGREFYILANNNPFGNNFRFTDDLGTQLYVNDIVVDWSTLYDGNVLAYKKTPTTGTASWDQLITTINALTIAGFSGWRLWNVREMQNIMDYSLGYVFQYAPFGIGETYFYTSTTWDTDSNFAFFSYANYGEIQKTVKNQTFGGIAVRNFTLNELGL